MKRSIVLTINDVLAKCCIRKVSLMGQNGYLFYPRYNISNNCVIRLSEKIHFRYRNKRFSVLTSLSFSLGIFVSFFSHFRVHIIVKQSIEEVLRFCFEWIQKTLPEPV